MDTFQITLLTVGGTNQSSQSRQTKGKCPKCNQVFTPEQWERRLKGVVNKQENNYQWRTQMEYPLICPNPGCDRVVHPE